VNAITPGQFGRRSSDRSVSGWVASRSARLTQIRWQPAAGGQFLLLTAGAIAVLTAPLLKPDLHAWLVIAAVSAAMTAGFGLSLAVEWSRLPRQAVLVFPLSVWVALSILGLTTHGVAGNYTGLIVLSFALIGMTQVPGTSLAMLPLAVATYICAFGSWSPELLPRLIIGVLIWLVLGELLAAFTARQVTLSLALQSAAHTDPLTGIGNRRDLHVRLAASAPGDTVIICDLDHFKALNDARGHLAGDQVLADFGMLLRSTLRGGDYSARFGGEEFVLLIPGDTAEDRSGLLRRLHEAWSVLQPDITFSTGSAVRTATSTPEHTLHEADNALYAAKRAGRDCDVHARTASIAEPAAFA
jgi:diguanylate cyclase (GGDEF)-like protein